MSSTTSGAANRHIFFVQRGSGPTPCLGLIEDVAGSGSTGCRTLIRQPGDQSAQASANLTASHAKRAAPPTASATPTDSNTENIATRRPIVFSITANVEMYGK